MRRLRPVPFVLVCAALALAGCGKGGGQKGGPGLLADGPFAGPLNLQGDQPFWRVRIRDKALILTGADGKMTSFPNGGPDGSKERAVWKGDGPNGQSIKATVANKPCQDPVTSIAYPFTATVETGGQTLKGCATQAGQGLGSRE